LFFLCTLRPPTSTLFPYTTLFRSLAMVADGVGGAAGGEEASRLAVGAITRYVTQAIHCYYSEDAMDEQRFPRALESAALRVHERSEEHTSELQSLAYLVCRLLLEK